MSGLNPTTVGELREQLAVFPNYYPVGLLLADDEGELRSSIAFAQPLNRTPWAITSAGGSFVALAALDQEGQLL